MSMIKHAGAAAVALLALQANAAEPVNYWGVHLGANSLDELWQLLIRAAVLWYAAFAVWILLL